MPSLRVRMSIRSRPERVFRTLMNFSGYREWNPWLKDVEGEAQEGALVSVTPNMVSLFGFRLRYRLARIQPQDFLRWEEVAWFDFLFRTVREYHVYTRLGGSAIYAVSLRFCGPLAPLVGIFYRHSVRQGLRREAEALKSYCEQHYPLEAPA